MTELKATIHQETGRIDKVLTGLFPDHSRSQIQLWLKEGAVSVNGQPVKANYKVKPADEIVVLIPEPETLDIIAEDIPLEIVYEDEAVAVVNKPQGMVVHPSAGHTHGTMVNALMYHVKNLSSINGVIRPGIVHRIDKDTSGLLMVAKNDQAHESLAKQLKDKTSLRKYVALVHGVIPHEKGTINAPIGRHPTNRKKMAINEKNGKPAITHYKVLERFSNYTYMEFKLETGRTHQIRVHMASIGHPLLGDTVYSSGKSPFKTQGQTLHAMTIGFIHPRTNEYMEISAPLPEYFLKILKSLH